MKKTVSILGIFFCSCTFITKESTFSYKYDFTSVDESKVFWRDSECFKKINHKAFLDAIKDAKPQPMKFLPSQYVVLYKEGVAIDSLYFSQSLESFKINGTSFSINKKDLKAITILLK